MHSHSTKTFGPLFRDVPESKEVCKGFWHAKRLIRSRSQVWGGRVRTRGARVGKKKKRGTTKKENIYRKTEKSKRHQQGGLVFDSRVSITFDKKRQDLLYEESKACVRFQGGGGGGGGHLAADSQRYLTDFPQRVFVFVVNVCARAKSRPSSLGRRAYLGVSSVVSFSSSFWGVDSAATEQ